MSNRYLPALWILLLPDGLHIANREYVVALIKHAKPRHHPGEHPCAKPVCNSPDVRPSHEATTDRQKIPSRHILDMTFAT